MKLLRLLANTFLVLISCRGTLGFLNSVHSQRITVRQAGGDLRAKNEETEKEVDALTKASWFAVEAFGKVFGSKSGSNDITAGTSYNLDEAPKTIQETKARLQEDNEREYFLSGKVDKLIYDEKCVFADPFVSFEGRDRFVENLANLGSFITKYSAKPLGYVEDEYMVETKFMVKLELNLPWKPILAWPWGVRCEIEPTTNLIRLHEESWDIEAIEGVKQIFRKPTTTI